MLLDQRRTLFICYSSFITIVLQRMAASMTASESTTTTSAISEGGHSHSDDGSEHFPMSEASVLNCQFHCWYPSLSRDSLKSEVYYTSTSSSTNHCTTWRHCFHSITVIVCSLSQIIEVPNEFVDFLLEDGVVLPPSLATTQVSLSVS
jgi:hypothetical protein